MFYHVLKNVNTSVNLIIEIRTAGITGSMQGLQTTAWTIMPLFNPADEPNIGRWRLPVYKPPTPLSVNLK